MIQRKPISISLQEDDIAMLNSLAEEVGLTKSELIRRLLRKMSADEKMKAIIKRGYLVTSHNVHYDKEGENTDESEGFKKPGDHSGPGSSSLEPTNNILGPEQEWLEKYTYEELAKIAKTKWLED